MGFHLRGGLCLENKCLCAHGKGAKGQRAQAAFGPDTCQEFYMHCEWKRPHQILYAYGRGLIWAGNVVASDFENHIFPPQNMVQPVK